ncbi:hypothetical protein HN953_04060 [Candidatus Woesearchaeota archaeon]|mgnify:FL=1|nr:hypothetical protein [Candidatus Woesearchaeota archaeon]
MVKNSQIHLMVDTELYEKLKSDARARYKSLSAHCTDKLKEDPETIKIQETLYNLMKEIADIKSRVLNS